MTMNDEKLRLNLISKIEEIEQKIEIIEGQLNDVKAALIKLRKNLTKEEKRLPVTNKDAVMIAFLLNGGKISLGELRQVLRDLGFNLESKAISNVVQKLKKQELVKSTQKGIYECNNLFEWLKIISQSPVSTYLRNIEPEKAKKLVEILFTEYCKKKKAFHIRRAFLEDVKKEFSTFYELIEKFLPDALIRLKERGLIKTETGHDGIPVGVGLPIAYVTYIGGD